MPKDPRDYGICTHLPTDVVKLYHGLDSGKPTLCSSDNRPILVILNGGTHFESNAQKTIAGFIDVAYHQLMEVKQSCEWPLHFEMIWTGLNAQSRALDSIYPRQSREKAQLFNEFVDQYVNSTLGMIPIDFLNLTKDAAVSDGLHYLSDVNLVKANVILHVANFLA